MWQNKRSNKKELLDLGHYTETEYNLCLYYLSRINLLLGGFGATKRAFEKPPRSVLEIGCGGGYLCRKLQKWFPSAQITGVDIANEAIVYAKKHNSGENITYCTEAPDESFEVVTTMLVTHHMNDEELITFLQESYRICSDCVIINDLQRHLLAYLSFSLIAPILFPNRLIWHDGRLSIKRAFRKKEWFSLLERAGFTPDQYTLKWNWAFRWTLTLRKT